ncbi:hypothetical protein HHUSO_G2917 [Huso huso]|uniref:Uncharacterized protein n=1 Tax=Huso huso TaxID=61971 RepID=A0ABR1A8D7_HUSHU
MPPRKRRKCTSVTVKNHAEKSSCYISNPCCLFRKRHCFPTATGMPSFLQHSRCVTSASTCITGCASPSCNTRQHGYTTSIC